MRHPIPSSLSCLLLLAAWSAAGATHTLWQIGEPDRNNADLALAPGKFEGFKEDGFFVVGSSSAAKDWPYVQPGPADRWAGNRQHTFAVVFGLQNVTRDQAKLSLAFLDTQAGSPPRLKVMVNGRAYEKQLPGGAGDDSVRGEPQKGKPFRWDIELEPGVLKTGENEVSITSLSGSWALYDCLKLETSGETGVGPVREGTRVAGIKVRPVWLKEGGGAVQPLSVELRHIGPPAGMASSPASSPVMVKLGQAPPVPLELRAGLQTVELRAPASEGKTKLPLEVRAGNAVLVATNIELSPPPIRTMWILPHSHVDIGYTHRQDEIVDAQIGHLEKAMELAKASANQAEGMRFKWNPEAVWTLDHYQKRVGAEKWQQFIKAVGDGEVGVDALYGNMLTALCRPEELAMCVSFGARLSNQTGRPVLSASICDVPGYTWGMVPIMAQAGVKYFAIGPNFADRVGTIHTWDDKPFYWKSQSGRDRILCWVVDNYHHLGDMEQNILAQVERQGRAGFPYDTSFIFWVGQWPNGAVDNAPPDEKTVEKVVAWNAKYAAPRVKIGLVNEFFRDFETKHGKQLPEYAGDLTPYWEDGAGSTSRETALNRESGEKLSQASTLAAMRQVDACPAAQVDEAWKNVLLYSEHTWGAWCSISKPDDAFTLDQWRVKQGFALEGARMARELLTAAVPKASEAARDIEVFNTTQWERTDLAIIPGNANGNAAGTEIRSVVDKAGKQFAVQRLASGELVFLARDIPAFGSKRLRLSTQACPGAKGATASGPVLDNGLLRVELNPVFGGISSLRLKGNPHEFVDASAAVGLNDYRYLLGTGAGGALANDAVKISVVDNGPVVATLRVESAAPGCNSLVRYVRVIDGLDRVELINEVDRKSVREKDGVHFGFGFHVPKGTIRMETPWAVVRPNADQLPGSCRNWFTVQRWVDVSARDVGITWAPVDAPLMEIGGMTANLLGSVALHDWMTNAAESTTLYSWAQNNHWHTNYKIDQPGVTTFRYVLRPHRGGYSAMESARFGMETTRPLLVGGATAAKAAAAPLLTLSSQDVLVETIKAGSDGKSLIVRLFGVTGKSEAVALRWAGRKPTAVWLSDMTERPLKRANGKVHVRPYEIVTLRADL